VAPADTKRNHYGFPLAALIVASVAGAAPSLPRALSVWKIEVRLVSLRICAIAVPRNTFSVKQCLLRIFHSCYGGCARVSRPA